jgi:predicted transcriptional regulator
MRKVETNQTAILHEQEYLHERIYSNLAIAVKNLNRYLEKHFEGRFRIVEQTARNYIEERDRITRRFDLSKSTYIEAKIIKTYMNVDIE